MAVHRILSLASSFSLRVWARLKDGSITATRSLRISSHMSTTRICESLTFRPWTLTACPNFSYSMAVSGCDGRSSGEAVVCGHILWPHRLAVMAITWKPELVTYLWKSTLLLTGDQLSFQRTSHHHDSYLS